MKRAILILSVIFCLQSSAQKLISDYPLQVPANGSLFLVQNGNQYNSVTGLQLKDFVGSLDFGDTLTVMAIEGKTANRLRVITSIDTDTVTVGGVTMYRAIATGSGGLEWTESATEFATSYVNNGTLYINVGGDKFDFTTAQFVFTTDGIFEADTVKANVSYFDLYDAPNWSDSIATATPDTAIFSFTSDTANFATLSDSSRITSELSGFDKSDYVQFSDSLTKYVTPDQLADSIVVVDSAAVAVYADSARAAATAEGSQGNFIASGDITGDNIISLGDITATFEVEAGTVRALDSLVTPQINMNGDEANGIAGSSQIDVLFHSVSFIDTTEVWGYKKVFMANSGRMYAMIEPHVFLFNPVDATGATQSVGTAWEKFSPGDSAFFEFVGRQNIDSVGNDTIGMVFSGHLWVDGSIGIAGSTGRTIDIRMYNVTKDAIVKSGGSVTTQGAGNRMDLNLKGYCINCHAGDKIIIQVRADQVTTFTFYRGEIRLDGNHGFE